MSPRDQERAARLVRKRFRTFQSLVDGALSTENVETIHDLRVCTRRLQQCFDALYPDSRGRSIRKAHEMLGRIRHLVGNWRNCDVALESLEAGNERDENARERIRTARDRAIAKARRRLARAGLGRVEKAVRKALARCESGRDLRLLARRSVRIAWHKWTRALSAAEAAPRVSRVHVLRIATKRLRYRVEFARDLGEPRAKEPLRWLEGLQNAIGRWHDRQLLLEKTGREAQPGRERADLAKIIASARRGSARVALDAWIRGARGRSTRDGTGRNLLRRRPRGGM
jgi:CHAD domain-containing protein